MRTLLIGEVAKHTGLTPATIRYYESIGLLSQPSRSDAGYRRYGESTLEEIGFIKKAQGLGFTLEEVHEILSLSRRGEAPARMCSNSQSGISPPSKSASRSSCTFVTNSRQTSRTGNSRSRPTAMASAR